VSVWLLVRVMSLVPAVYGRRPTVLRLSYRRLVTADQRRRLTTIGDRRTTSPRQVCDLLRRPPHCHADNRVVDCRRLNTHHAQSALSAKFKDDMQ